MINFGKRFFFAHGNLVPLIVISKNYSQFIQCHTIHFKRNKFASHYKIQSRKEKKKKKISSKVRTYDSTVYILILFHLANFHCALIDFFFIIWWIKRKKINFSKLVTKAKKKQQPMNEIQTNLKDVWKLYKVNVPFFLFHYSILEVFFTFFVCAQDLVVQLNHLIARNTRN